MKCTRCRDESGEPTGIVRGGECFQCRGTGTRQAATSQTSEEIAAMKRRAAAIQIIRSHTRDWRVLGARVDLEGREPERHLKLIESVMSGRVEAVIAALLKYSATENP